VIFQNIVCYVQQKKRKVIQVWNDMRVIKLVLFLFFSFILSPIIQLITASSIYAFVIVGNCTF